jgi:hypothetical protein
MIDKFFDLLLDYLKTKSYWRLLEPLVTLVSLYVVSCVIVYQYIEWRYGFTPEIGTFLHSYVFKQVGVVFLVIALLALVLGTTWKREVGSEIRSQVLPWVRAGARRLVVAGVIVASAVATFLALSPHKVSHIRVKFLEHPTSVDPNAFAYIVYELNRARADWHFDFDADPYNPASRTSEEAALCGEDPLCNARLSAAGQPFIGISEAGFDQGSFWMNSGSVSVISAGQWKDFEPPSTYEYLAYSLIVQAALIHLNRNCGGLPADAFQPSRQSYGDTFEFAPRRGEMKVALLAAHLNPRWQERLANCFGLDYMNTCDRLLSLDWLHTGRVHDNLAKDFKVDL